MDATPEDAEARSLVDQVSDFIGQFWSRYDADCARRTDETDAAAEAIITMERP